MTDLEMNPPAAGAVDRPQVIRSYVAIGDSLTEGMEDDSGPGGEYRGFADRLAEHLGTLTPDFRYANLGVRGRRMRHIFGEQLEQTLEWKPDLVTVLAGGNDVLRPGNDLDELAEQFEQGVRRLRDAGIRVVILAGHDTGWIPVLRLYRGRIAVFSMHMRAVAERTGTEIVDLWALNALNDPRAWGDDRLHPNGAGHQIVAARVADLLGHPMGPRESWTDPWATPPRQLPRILRRRENRRWARQYLVPWLRRRAMGRSSGDGLLPRRPELDYLYDEETRERLRRELERAEALPRQDDRSVEDARPTISPSGVKGPEPLR
ncbi:GDSL-like Lipase/Acylhydrolase family protein [Nocardiopsis alba ATCC BAA-2165]|uniref:GDSL-like Lipase/Acylhydrolase family protein n=3 Tax=Nocardiopsis alba TaxID=53437 RepID=J7L6B6_NOCAA|nr:GDSL-like Lipase/Acylhydrolase family protein [Nocardiopsis alba ATCC BAA-2165]